jgi:hypothetical protein
MPADGAQAAALRGISARPAGSTDEITSVLAAQKEGENGRKWPDPEAPTAAGRVRLFPLIEVDLPRRRSERDGSF